jgi:hypothetical protein
MMRLADIFTEEELRQRKAQRDEEYRRLTTEFPVNCPSCHRPNHGSRHQYVHSDLTDTWWFGHRCRHCMAWICLPALGRPAHASPSGAH